MNPICTSSSFSSRYCLLLIAASLACFNGVALTRAGALDSSLVDQQQQQQLQDANLRANVSEEMQLITKSLEDLLNELALIKREATGRLSQVKNRNSISDQERIRQTKVSRFVLTRVAELEAESMSMREELKKLFGERKSSLNLYPTNPEQLTRQEDHDFDDPPAAASSQSPSTTTGAATSQASSSTLKPEEEEAAKIGFDLEALKKLGAELESEIEARAQQTPESIRGVHEQAIKLVDNMVQNYLGNVRRAIQRMSNFIDNRRTSLVQGPQQPRESPESAMVDSQIAISGQLVDGFAAIRQSVLNRIQLVSKRMHEFTMQWTRAIGKQQSPLLDRIPPRGVELWRDFWDTVRKQVRRINQEVSQLAHDMSRMLTGRLPNGPTMTSLLYSAEEANNEVAMKFQALFEKMSAAVNEEQHKLESLNKVPGQHHQAVAEHQEKTNNNLIDENDDEATRDELNRNVALRQQIQQEINVFGSIFDIMSTFIKRLRESATNTVRDVLRPGASANNNNDPVTPGPSVKPQVDQLLGETINSQRNINSQAKPVLLPNDRPSVHPLLLSSLLPMLTNGQLDQSVSIGAG